MKRFFFLAVAFAAISIQQVHAQNEKPAVELKNLPDTILQKRALTVAGPFDGTKVLKQLFPGKFYNLSEKNYKNELISWECKTCTAKTYHDANGVEDEPVFPFAGGVATRLLTVLDLSDSKGGQYKILTFSHSEYDPDGLRTGRFIGGLFGLAKFSKADNGWVLKHFQPAIGAYGAFASCPTPKALLIGEDQYAFSLEPMNGPGGGPFSADYYLVAGANMAYSQVLAAYDVERAKDEYGTEWKSDITVLQGDKKYFGDIVIITHGTYHANEDESFFDNFQNKIKGLKSFKFSFTRTYVYSAAKGYELKNTSDLTMTEVKK
jgi:hypothetical protein